MAATTYRTLDRLNEDNAGICSRFAELYADIHGAFGLELENTFVLLGKIHITLSDPIVGDDFETHYRIEEVIV